MDQDPAPRVRARAAVLPLGRQRSVDDFAGRVGDLGDGRGDRVAQGEPVVRHAVHLGRGIGTDAQDVGYGIPREKWLGRGR